MSHLQQHGTTHDRPAKPPFPVALAYGSLVAIFFAPFLLGLAAFPEGDFTHHFLPFSLFQQDALLNLRLPVWLPYANAGHPFLADAQSAVFYPISNILLLLTGFVKNAAGRLYWLQAEAGLHLFLACLFTYMLVRRLTGRRVAGFAAGIIFGFSGYLTSYPLLQVGVVRTAVWLPLILLLLLPQRAGAHSLNRWLMAAAVQAVAFFAGHPQTFLFLTYAVAGWMLMLAFVELRKQRSVTRKPRPESAPGSLLLGPPLRIAGRALAFVAALIALTLGQLWPAVEFARRSVRAFVGSDYLRGGFPPEDTWQFLFPGVLSHFSPQYIGIAGLGLALVALAGLFSTRFTLPGGDPVAGPAALFFLICGGAAWLLSYGENGPIYELFFRFAPGGNLFRGQERAIYLAAFSLSILSGYGLAMLSSLPRRLRRNLSWAFAGAVTVGAALFFTWWPLPENAEFSRPAFLYTGSKSLLLAIAFAGLCGLPELSRTRILLLLPVLVIDLFLTNFATNIADGPSIRAALARPEEAATLQAANTLASETEGLVPRVYNEDRLPRSSGISAGWEDVWGSSPLRTLTFDSLFVDFPLARMWELTGVGTVLTWREELPVASQLIARFELPDGSETRLHQLESISHRFWWTQEARRVDDRTALALLADASFDPKKELLIAKSDAGSLGNAWEDDRMTFGDAGAASIAVEQKGPAHYVIRIESDQPGLLFISENYMPGWLAEWSGEEKPSKPTRLPIARAHQAFLGIPVPAGSGTLELAYRPASVRWGLAISAAGWLALLFALRKQLMVAFRKALLRLQLFGEALWTRTFSTPAAREDHEKGRAGQGGFRPSSQGLFSDRQMQRTAVLFATLTGFALRFYRLGFQELDPREAFSFWFSQLSFSEMVQLFNDLGEPLFLVSFWLQHLWRGFAGTSEFALRSVSALFGALAIPLVYRLAKELRLPAFPSLTVTLLMALSTYAVSGSQDVLLYPLSLTLSIAGIVMALRLINGSGSKTIYAAYVLCGAAAVYTQAFAVLALLAQNMYVLYLLARDSRSGGNSDALPLVKSLLWRWTLAQFAILALCVPWLVSAWPATFEFGGNFTASSLSAILWWRFTRYPIGYQVPDSTWLLNAGLFAAAIIAAAFVGACLGDRREASKAERGAKDGTEIESQEASETQEAIHRFPDRNPTVLLLLYLLVTPFAYWTPLYQEWYMYGSFYAVALPPFLLLLSIGVTNIGGWIESWLGWRWRIWADDTDADGRSFLSSLRVGSVGALFLILVIVAGNLFTLRNHHFGPEFTRSRGLRELSAMLERWSAGLDPAEAHFIQSFPDPTVFIYYYAGEVENSVLPRHDHDIEGAVDAVNVLREEGVQRIILPVSLDQDQEAPNMAREALSGSYQLAGQETVGPWLVELYSRPHPQAWRLFNVEFTNGLTLERAQISPNLPPAGGRLVVHMEWSGDPAALTGGEKLFLHLLDDKGKLVAQWDPGFRMKSPQLSTSVAMPIPSPLPAGPLRLVGGLYDVTLEGTPRILTENGEDSHLLVYFQVSECDDCGR
ncbi:MAG: hypothetical protein OXH73_17200 [Caldilineaceae bacterium]|nr:hypothetical protein [Caldilineaceae bacterium]